jgi:hypothetical protein
VARSDGNRTADVDAYLGRLDHPLKAEVEARRPALKALVRQWVELMDREG